MGQNFNGPKVFNGVTVMYSMLIVFALCNLLYFALHITGNGNSFPKPLSSKEERECFEKAAQGDGAARNKLIEHNLRLVAYTIKRFYSNQKDQEDLISIGTIGLIKAVSTYDYQKGTRFATYATKCIENEILMHFRGAKKTSQDVFISDPIDSDKEGNALTLQDVMSDDVNILDHIDLRIKAEKLYQYLDNLLSPREKQAVIMRYGLFGTQPMTQREVADKLEISRSYVSRIEKRALQVLKKQFKKDGFND